MVSSSNFPGFKRSYKKGGFFMYPTELEKYWHTLSGAEQKLLDFILRRTYGFQKLEDRISLSQFVDGVGKSQGPGVSRAQVQRSLKGLEEKGFIRTERHGYQTRLVKLVLRDEQPEQPAKEKVAASGQVAYLISLFRDIAPTLVDKFMTERKQVEAIERLLGVYGQEKLEQLIAAAKEVAGRQFAPSITSPVELEEKHGKLIGYYQREEDKKRNEFRISL